MPTYDYLCQDCDYRFEEFQSIVAEPLQSCPRCNGKVERLINGGIGLIFKGSGFYLTDYARSKNSDNNKSSNTKKSGDKKPESKKTTETKKATANSVG
jgi:putative FmdB family regulatory protein